MKHPDDKLSLTRWEREDEDVRLMVLFQKGDFSAFEKIVEHNTPRIHSLLYRFLGSGSHVDDITQEVFLRVFRARDKYQPKAKFATWLYKIVARLSYNFIRSKKTKMSISLDGISDSNETFRWDIVDRKFSVPGADLDREELGEKVAQAIAKLPNKQKMAIILNKYEGKSYAEVAEVLDVSTVAVKSILARARCQLRDILRHYMQQ